MDQLTCTDCGIRFSAELASCPWCGADAPAVTSGTATQAATEERPVEDVDAGFVAAPAQPPTPEVADPGTPPDADPAAEADVWDLGDAEPSPTDDAGLPAASEDPQQVSMRDWEPVAVDPVVAPTVAADDDGRADGEETPPDDSLAPHQAPLVTREDEWDDDDGWESTLAMPTVPGQAEQAPEPDPRFTGQSAALADPTGTPPKKPWKWKGTVINVGIIALLLALGALIAEFAPIGGSGDETEPITAATIDPGVTVVVETTVATTLPPTTVTTVPPTTAPPTTVTTTTVPPTTTTLPPIDPIGDPIAIADLSMGVDGLGELEIGSDGSTVVGRLVASLGQPNGDTGIVTSGGELGTCADQRIRAVRFGSLTVINVVETGGSEVFAAYRLLDDPDGVAYPSDDMTTISGITTGDTVARLKVTYAGLDVSFVQVAGETFFELRTSSGVLLLHGPVTSPADQGVVQGIYSPDACTP